MQAARRPPHKPEPDQPQGLAPEIGVSVQALQAEIERTIQVANLSDQDLGAVLKTQSALVGLLYRMLTDHALAVSKAGLDASQILPPLLDRVDQGLRREVPAIRRAFDRRTSAWQGCGVVALFVCALALGWWWGSGSVLEICRAGQVLHAVDGRAYCAAWFPTK